MSHMIDLKGNILVVRYRETISIEDVELAEQEVAKNPRYEQVTGILIDLTGVDFVDFNKTKTLESSFIVRAIFNKILNMKLAVANTHPDLRGFVQLFLDDFSGSGWAVKGFTSSKDAYKWLGSAS